MRSFAPKTYSFVPKTINLMHINSSNTLNTAKNTPRNMPEYT